MLEDASNGELLAGWMAGNQSAAALLYERYMWRLTALVRARLSRKLAQRVDPEDIVLSAWRSFFVAVGKERFAVPDNDDLWPLLVTLTRRKLARQSVRNLAQGRDLQIEQPLTDESDWRKLIARDPAPEEAALLTDEVEAVLLGLDAFDRDVFSRRLGGEDQLTIAAALQCSDRTVRRALQRISELIAARHNESDSARLAASNRRQPSVAHVPPEPPRHVPGEHELSFTPTVEPGELLLQNMVGEGGIGKVYRAQWKRDGSTVAVKYLKKRFWQVPRAVENLIRETLLTSSLSHPHIIQHLGWGRAPRGAAFIVMEWVDGCDAGKWAGDGPPPFRDVLACAEQIAAALAAAHAAGIIHGDVTPRNVLRQVTGRFVLTDFGFAHSLAGQSPAARGGTPAFLAPEQLADVFGQIGPRTDVYGLGGLLYFLLTGHPPMAGKSRAEIVARVLSSGLPRPLREAAPTISESWRRLVERCLAKNPSERPDSLREVQAELRHIGQHLAE